MVLRFNQRPTTDAKIPSWDRITSTVQNIGPAPDVAAVPAFRVAPTWAAASMAYRTDDNGPPTADSAAGWDRCAGKADDWAVYRRRPLHSVPRPERRPYGCADAGTGRRRCRIACHSTRHRCRSTSRRTASGRQRLGRPTGRGTRRQLPPPPLLPHSMNHPIRLGFRWIWKNHLRRLHLPRTADIPPDTADLPPCLCSADWPDIRCSRDRGTHSAWPPSSTAPSAPSFGRSSDTDSSPTPWTWRGVATSTSWRSSSPWNRGCRNLQRNCRENSF